MSTCFRVELIKDGVVVGTYDCSTAPRERTIKHAVEFLKKAHETIDTDMCVQKGTYAALRVKWFGGDFVTHYLTGEELLVHETIK